MKIYKILIFIFVIIVCASLLVWYLNQTLIPQKLKSLLIQTFEKQTQLSLQIQDLKFSIIKGLEFKNIEIFKKGYKEQPLLKADRAWFKPFVIPSFRKIHIVIPAITLESVNTKIERDKDGNWNFQKPAPAEAKPPSPKKKRISFSVLKASVEDAAVTFNDNFQDRNISETLTDVNANLGLSLPHSLSLALSAQFRQSPIDLKGKMRLEPDSTFIITAAANLKSFEFKKENLHLLGDFDIDTQLQGNIKAAASFSYKGSVNFKKATVGFSDVIPAIQDATGKVLFVNKSITIRDFTGKIADSDVSLSGKLDYSAEFPEININIFAEAVDLNKLIQGLPQTAKDKFKQIDLDGKADLNINIANKKDQPRAFGYKGDLKISGANLGCPWLKERIKDIDCNLIFEKDTLTWDKLSFKYKDIPYTSSGIASELTAPLINGALESKDFKIKGEIKIEEQLLTIQKLDAVYKNFSLKAKGFIKDFKQPLASFIISAYDGAVDINAKLNLQSKEKPYLIDIEARNIDLKKLAANTKFSKSKVKGIFLAKATLNGYLDDKDSLKGNGWVQVTEGYLLEFPVVFKLVDAILGIPPEYITLTDAFGNFTISGKRIYTSDFKMLGEKMALLWEGSLGFNGSLDFNITGRFAEDITKMTTSFGKIASALLHKAGAYIVEVKLTGTLEKPEYKIVPFPIKKIMEEKVIDKFKDVLGDIFE